jgi:hypothetical protein
VVLRPSVKAAVESRRSAVLERPITASVGITSFTLERTPSPSPSPSSPPTTTSCWTAAGRCSSARPPSSSSPPTPPRRTPELLGLLNSSTACFWMKQVFHNKGGTGGLRRVHGIACGDVGVTVRARRHQTQAVPHPPRHPSSATGARRPRPAARPNTFPARLCERAALARRSEPHDRAQALRARMVALQEELDWECYHLYGLTDGAEPPLDQVPDSTRGERAFEIALARTDGGRRGEVHLVRAARLHTHHRAAGIWPAAYRSRWRSASNSSLGPKAACWSARVQAPLELGVMGGPGAEALRDWLLARLEELDSWADRSSRPWPARGPAAREDPQPSRPPAPTRSESTWT